MNGLSEIYTELIAEESRNPENRRHLPHPTCCEKGHNPSCGDEITLELEVQDGRIADASFTGNGCAISQASASLMINLRMIKGEVTDVGELEELEDAAALQSISHMPARVKCALLSWRTLEKALDKPGRG